MNVGKIKATALCPSRAKKELKLIEKKESVILVVIPRNAMGKLHYQNLWSSIYLFMQKMNNHVTEVTKEFLKSGTLDPRNAVFTAISTKESYPLVALPIINKADISNLYGVTLMSDIFNIDIKEHNDCGKTDLPDECLYGIYNAYIKYLCMLKFKELASNIDTLDIITSYLYYITAKSFGRSILLDSKRKLFIALTIATIAAKHYLNYTHQHAIKLAKQVSLVKQYPLDQMKSEIDDYLSRLDSVNHISHLFQVLKSTNIVSELDPLRTLLQLFQKATQPGYVHIYGPLSYIMSLICTLNYPTRYIFPSFLKVDSRIHQSAVQLMKQIRQSANYKLKPYSAGYLKGNS